MVTLTFHGAAGTVTGSRTLLESRGERLLVDCGMFQGLKELREANWEDPPFDARSLRWVVLTHAHIDHCGWLPRLYKAGFRGQVLATPGTTELARLMLLDAAHLQEEDAEYLNVKGATKHRPALPLYDERDAQNVLSRFASVPYGRWKKLSTVFSFRFVNVGHLLGSAMVEVRVAFGPPVREGSEDESAIATERPARASPALVPSSPEHPVSEPDATAPPATPLATSPAAIAPSQSTVRPRELTVLFSGDVGRYDAPLAPDPDPPPPCDVLVIESTYGDRSHGEEDVREEIAKIAEATFARGGVLLVPAFAVGRSQQVLFLLRELYAKGRLPRVPIHLDSPMATDATRIYARHWTELDPIEGVKEGEGFLAGPFVAFHRTRDESKRLNTFEGPGIIVSASGMLTGGRILHHLSRRLSDARNTVLLVGFQAAGTRGRALVEGAPYLRFHGSEVPVRAEVRQIHGLSGHADAGELMRWTAGLPAPRATFVTHGEPEVAEAFAATLRRERGWTTFVPSIHQRFRL